MANAPRVLLLTPVKDAASHAGSYFSALAQLSYPRHLLSIGILEGDSTDGTAEVFQARLAECTGSFGRIGFWRHDFGFHLPPGVPRYEACFQVQRRSALAKARNHLLFHALDEEEWVLWLDVDVVEYPPDVIERLLAVGKDVVQPHCVVQSGGTSFDLNAWRDHGSLHIHDLRGEGELARLDSVGGTMLLVRADRHRDGLVFPCFPYGIGNPKIRLNNHWLGEIETEGMGIMADDMGIECWAMPLLEIKHHSS